MSDHGSRKGPRFSMRGLMLLTLVVAVAAASWGGLRGEGQDRYFYVLFATWAPVGLLVLVGCWHQLLKWRRRRR